MKHNITSGRVVYNKFLSDLFFSAQEKLSPTVSITHYNEQFKKLRT